MKNMIFQKNNLSGSLGLFNISKDRKIFNFRRALICTLGYINLARNLCFPVQNTRFLKKRNFYGVPSEIFDIFIRGTKKMFYGSNNS